MMSLPLATTATALSSVGKPFRFGVVTDCQYADIPDSEKMDRRYRRSPSKLKEAISALNRSELEFIVNLGDTIDQSFPSLETVLPIFREAKAPIHHLLGNHDYSVVDELKPLVARRMGLEGPLYRSWHGGNWRFIALDGNEVSLFAHRRGSEAHAAAVKIHQGYKPAPPTYNGAIGAGQLHWLTGQLEAARLHREKVILFCHYPIFPVNHHNLWNDKEVLALIANYRDVVAAWMNGHNHAGNIGQHEGIHCVTFKGMVDTQQNCWAEVSLFADRIEITGFAREPRRELKLA